MAQQHDGWVCYFETEVVFDSEVLVSHCHASFCRLSMLQCTKVAWTDTNFRLRSVSSSQPALPAATTAALPAAVVGVLQLLALDLSGLVQVSDSLAPTLAQLQQLQVLQLSHTSCSDATLEWLTYGSRLHQWQQQQRQGDSSGQFEKTKQLEHPVGEWHRCVAHSTAEGGWHASSTCCCSLSFLLNSQQYSHHRNTKHIAEQHLWSALHQAEIILIHEHYKLCRLGGSDSCLLLHVLLLTCRTRIRQWHLAHTRITAKAAELLLCCPDIIFLDLRGSGVKAHQLLPLRTKFQLSAVQGAVLSRSAAVAAAAVSHDAFLCVDPSAHSSAAGVTAAAVSGQQDSLQQWVLQGVAELLKARQEAIDAEAEAGAAAAAAERQRVAAWRQQQQQQQQYSQQLCYWPAPRAGDSTLPVVPGIAAGWRQQAPPAMQQPQQWYLGP
jgi:hypothetical protein